MTSHGATDVELSRIIEARDLAEGAVQLEIHATAAERAALARRFGLLSVDRLDARVTVARLPGGAFRVRGRMRADVVQSCVVTLAPVPAHLDEVCAATWSPQTGWEEEGEAIVEVAGETPVEGAGDAVDVGEAVAQQLALALDPYPRAAGATVEQALPRERGDDAGPEEPKPFAVLAEFGKQRQ